MAHKGSSPQVTMKAHKIAILDRLISFVTDENSRIIELPALDIDLYN